MRDHRFEPSEWEDITEVVMAHSGKGVTRVKRNKAKAKAKQAKISRRRNRK